MARVIITNSLIKEIHKKFREESLKIFNLMKNLETYPSKGKLLSAVGNILIKEIKYNKFRFYFLTDGNKIKFASEDELSSILIKFVAMSEKKDQQTVIDKIKNTLKSLGFDEI